MSHWNFEIAGNQKIHFEIAGIPAIAGRFASLSTKLQKIRKILRNYLRKLNYMNAHN